MIISIISGVIQAFFTPAETHVPLIIHWPGKAAHTYTHYTSHFDIVPTIMSQLLGVTNSYC